MKTHPVPTHVFRDAGTTNAKGVRDCADCQLNEARTDVHNPPPQTPEQRAHDAARLGESEGTDR